jgi:hypothetical protein
MFSRKKSKKEVIILGKQTMMEFPETRTFKPRVETRIYWNPNDRDYLPKLNRIGFDITQYNNNILNVWLPYNWSHFRRSIVEEIIVDDQGRVRLLNDLQYKRSELVRRFNYQIELVDSTDPNLKIQQVRCILTECGLKVQELVIPPDKYQRFIKCLDNSKENLVKFFDEYISKFYNDMAPDWKDETKYWEYNYMLLNE